MGSSSRVWSLFGAGVLWWAASPLGAVPQLQLVSQSVPELRSDTAMGRSTTSIYPDNLRPIYAHSPRASADGRWVVFARI